MREEDPGRLPGGPVIGSQPDKGEEGMTSLGNRKNQDMEPSRDRLWVGKRQFSVARKQTASQKVLKNKSERWCGPEQTGHWKLWLEAWLFNRRGH